MLAIFFLAMGIGSSDDRFCFVNGRLVVKENWGYVQLAERPAKSGKVKRRFMSALIDSADVMKVRLRIKLKKFAHTFGCVQDG